MCVALTGYIVLLPDTFLIRSCNPPVLLNKEGPAWETKIPRVLVKTIEDAGKLGEIPLLG